MKSIYTALVMYQLDHGFAPTTVSYGGANWSGWDNSVEGSFMSFLVDSGYIGEVPIDPVNNATGAELSTTSNGTYGYRYFCYPGIGVSLGYRQESNGLWTHYSKTHALGTADALGRDNFFSCGSHP